MECEVCGHESEEAFEVVRHVGRHRFDTFECAIFAMAPQCARCGVRVIGHGIKEGDHTFCCAHCAEAGPSKEGNPGGGEGGGSGSGGEASDAGEDEDTADDDDDEEDESDSDDDDDDDDESDGGDSGGGDEPDDDQRLDDLGQRISQARQNSDDLLSGPEDEVDQDESDVEPEAEVGAEEEERSKGKEGDDGGDDNNDDDDDEEDKDS
ncbi:MAG TPA: hypothetical protein VK988_09165 [Acidimicrobiales bacterium]|nr:hypothetical protein [Acidimicrobiales bacterium]